MAGISGRSSHTTENRFKFNEGSEFQNKEFSDGNGLDWYGTDYRGYDPQLGLFRQIDPLAESTDSWGVYSFGFNNPITFNDPLGLTPSSTGKFCEECRNQETSEPEPKWQVLPNVDVVAKVKSKSTLANSTFGWANQIQGSEISAWRNDLYGYQRLRDQGLSSSQAGARHQVNAADFERRYQAEQSWRFANYVLLDVLTSFLPLPKLSTARLARSLVATKIVRNPVASSAAKVGGQLLLKPGAANLTQQGLEHIVSRHWFSSGAKGAGKFLEGTTARGLKEMIGTATTNGVFRANTMGRAGTIAEYNFGRVIGTTSGGAPASSLRVVIGTNGNVITAFPF